MSRKWLLFLFCLLLPPLALPSRAELTLRVNESAIVISFPLRRVEVALPLENSLRTAIDQRIDVELIDPENRIRARVDKTESILRGKQTLKLTLPFDISQLPATERRQLLWYRLHYRLTSTQAPFTVAADGIVSLSEIAPDFFDVRVAAAEMAHEAMRYHARVQTTHPLTEKPAQGTRVDAVLVLETDDDGGGVRIPASGVTDSKGYARLFFDLPARFPQFPHEIRPAGGSLKITAQRGGLTAEVEHDVLIDQFPRIVVSTDKPLYQPGQHLHIRALVLTPSKHALANQDIVFRIQDPEDTNVFRETSRSSRFGVASVDWAIPENARLGDYSLKVALDAGDASHQGFAKVRISRYDLPNFSVKVQPDHPYYVPGQNAAVKVSADYLFGQPLKRGHVRVVREVEREWNYKEQRWDVEEGDKYEGEADADGVFLARVNLSEDHEEIADEGYRRFTDITYAAYFTDPTTNRTEQRRFDLRVTKNPIHVYVIRNEYSYRQSSRLPIEFYISTFYADGTPAPCKVSISVKDDDEEEDRLPSRRLLSLRTNRYGLAKVSALRLPSMYDDDDIELEIAVRDSRGRNGIHIEELRMDEDEDSVRVETDKSLYRPGEPVVASITSTVSNLRAVVDVVRDSIILSSQTVRLNNGQALVTLPYKSEFKDRLTIAAYADFADSSEMISARTVLYPRNRDLKIDVQTMAESYRPGDEAAIGFRVRNAHGETASALGVAIVDKAVNERFRTDGEFGYASVGFYESVQQALGGDDQIAGVTLRDLEHLDMNKQVPRDLELAAEILLNQNQNYRPVFFGGESYSTAQQEVFAGLTNSQLAPVRHALVARYEKTGRYPNNEPQLRALLSEAGIDLQTLRDPWGNLYRPFFSIDKEADVLSFHSSGADKRIGTDDDFMRESNRWAYFRPVGEAIDRAVRGFPKRTGKFIRSFDVLLTETAAEGHRLDNLQDRWNQPYRVTFDVEQSSYVIRVRSSGPDKKFEVAPYYSGDDFVVWMSRIDYFAESRARINEILAAQLQDPKTIPSKRTRAQRSSSRFRCSGGESARSVGPALLCNLRDSTFLQ